MDGLNGFIVCELVGLVWNNFVKVIGFFFRFYWNIFIVRGYLFEYCKEIWGIKFVVIGIKELVFNLGFFNVMKLYIGYFNGWLL